jgi:hypothetical protein
MDFKRSVAPKAAEVIIVRFQNVKVTGINIAALHANRQSAAHNFDGQLVRPYL